MSFSRHSIRTKIAATMISLLAVVSLTVFLYFPARLHRQLVEAVTQKSTALTSMAAQTVAEGLAGRNPVAVASALTGLRNNPDIVYLMLLDEHGKPFASFNDLVARKVEFDRLQMRPMATPQHGLQAGRRQRPSTSREIRGGITAEGNIYQTMAAVDLHGRRIGRLYTGMSLDAANADAAESRATIALFTIVSFLLTALAVFALSTLITVPLQRIVDTTDQIAAGDFSRRAMVKGNDEVGQLAHSFNRMVERVEEWNSTLESRVAERTRELAASEEQYRLLFERNLAGVYVSTEEGIVFDCNDACAQLLGYTARADLLAAGRIDYIHAHQRDSIVRRLREHGTVANEEVELRAADGSLVWAIENVRRIPASATNPPTLEGILLDISDRKRAENQIAFKAYHDELTGLPNRALFLDRLDVALAKARRNHTSEAVMFLDLDNMKSINDTFGHATGDRVLRAVAERLTRSIRQGDTVARVGGDEFLILLSNVDAVDAEEVARHILTRISESLSIARDELYLTTSIGLALYPADGEDGESLIRNADGAMYRAKETGGNSIELSSRSIRRSVGRLSLEEQLREGIERDEFVLHYQPQVDLATRKLAGAEALVRWQRTDGSLVSPAGFITVCEQSGIINELGEVVLLKACRQMMEWQKRGPIPERMSVNVSARQFYQRDFAGTVQRILRESGLPPSRLQLEITESVAMQTSERALEMLQQFRAMGVSVAVDDFGTGQSSLTYLKRFPIDTVKIDRSFVDGLDASANDEWIITTILMLANHLGLRTIAEGVTTEKQCAFLLSQDCREIQGFLISPPLDAAAFEEQFLAMETKPAGRRAGL
jgi:diguanylate cyclase (GGDEF)-like protein/PAS domain S-box-containing protein